jgi:hypothetical protein
VTSSDDDRTFYALGTVVARRAKHFAPTAPELAIVKRAITDSIRGLPLPVSVEAQDESPKRLAEQRLPLVAAAGRADGERALVRAAREPNAVITSTGVVRRSLSAGNGRAPGAACRRSPAAVSGSVGHACRRSPAAVFGELVASRALETDQLSTEVTC